jgi:hypothetical protein
MLTIVERVESARHYRQSSRKRTRCFLACAASWLPPKPYTNRTTKTKAAPATYRNGHNSLIYLVRRGGLVLPPATENT